MKIADARELIDQRWKAEWLVQQPTVTQWAFENETFRGTDPLWALVFARHTTRKFASQGPEGKRLVAQRGNILVMLFGAIDRGGDPLDDLAASVQAVFEGKTLGVGANQIWTYATAPNEAGKGGKTTDGKWHMLTLITPFMYYDRA